MCAAPWRTAHPEQRLLYLVTTNRGFPSCSACFLLGSYAHSALRGGSLRAAAIASAAWHNFRADSRAAASSASLDLTTVLLGTDAMQSPVCSPLTSASTVTPWSAGVKVIPTTTESR